jgi:N-acetylmuramoyl-L-alanine amidase
LIFLPKVFLSPSTQEWNQYVNGGTEEQYMNLLADAMEPLLTATGIDYVRNDPARNVLGAIEDSNNGNYDVHLALHTNAAGGDYAGKIQGVDIYYSPYSDLSKKLAEITVDNMKGVYPNPDKVRTLPTTSLAEVNRTKAVTILAELGYHDNPEDAAWIKANIPNMAKALTKSLAQYFGIPYIEGGASRKGVIVTDGSNLNVRRSPSTDAQILAVLPNRLNVTILGESGNWYLIRNGDTTGYVSKDFVNVVE